MSYKNLIVSVLVALVAVGTFAVADEAKDAKSAVQMKLPPGWTESDMQACMAAGIPGKMHEHLAKGIGTWQGKSTMWMYPGADPLNSECTSTVSSMLGGKFIKVEQSGEMPGMGPYNGFGVFGFDNVTEKFVATWIDSCGTGIANGTGELSSDGKTLTWNFTYNCPLTKKPVTLREIEAITGENTKTLEVFGTDVKSGKEFKMMAMELTKK